MVQAFVKPDRASRSQSVAQCSVEPHLSQQGEGRARAFIITTAALLDCGAMSAAALLAVAVALLTAIITLAPAKAASDPPPFDTITLRPGLNAVGWVSEPRSTADLFDEIPQLESIWTWDSWEQRWRSAAPAVPSSLHTLKRLAPGETAFFVLTGDAPIDFERPLQVATGTVSLNRGYNIVTWLGRDDVPLSHALKGIGRSLQSAQIWNSEAQAWTTPPEGAAINRGAPLNIITDWGIQWLQPTYVMPPVKTPGLSAWQRQMSLDAIRQVMEFHDKRWAIQADPFVFTVYAGSSYEALARQFLDVGLISPRTHSEPPIEYIKELLIRNGEPVGGTASYGAIVHRWPTDATNRYISSLYAHEYFHVLQAQFVLHDRILYDPRLQIDERYGYGHWIQEGSAEFAQHTFVADQYSIPQSREQNRILRSLTDQTPQLADLFEGGGDQWRWGYTLGYLAVEDLVASAGEDALIEVWRSGRQLQSRGPGMRWIRPFTVFIDSFQRAFGLEFESWLASFTRWQCEQVARNEGQSATKCDKTESSAPNDAETAMATVQVTGIVVGPGNVPIPSVPIYACNEERTLCGASRTISAPDGTFDLSLPPTVKPYLLVLELGLDCPYPYVAGAIPGQGTAGIHYGPAGTHYEVGPDGLADIRIAVPINACGTRITGTVRMDTGSSPKELMLVEAHSRYNAGFVWTRDGRFWITVSYTATDMPWAFEFSFLHRQSVATLGFSGHCSIVYAPTTPESYIYAGDGWTISDHEFHVPAEGIDGLEIIVNPKVCTP